MAFLKATRDKAIALLRRLRDDRSGNVLMFFGFAMIPAIGLTGAAIDYARATTVRAQLSAAVDSAALMAARDASKLSDADLRSRIDGWIKATLSPDEAAKFTGATIAIDRTARTVTINAKVPVEKTVFRVINADDMQVASSSQSSWGTNTIELALVLDNTGSMKDDNKMTELKAGSRILLDIMKKAVSEPDQIKISIVPFNNRVSLPTSYKNSPWLRFDDQVWVPGTRWASGYYRNMTADEWSGCIVDRDKSYDVTDGAASTYDQKYPGTLACQYKPVNILPLTNDWTALDKTIGNMQPVGATNVTIGLAWGMATLSPEAPFTEARAANTPRLSKYLIVLTDGKNTQNRWDGNGSDASPPVRARMELACNAAKDKGIIVYAIKVIDGDTDILKRCASSLDKFYDVSSAEALRPVFKAIADQISQVRLTR
jgi:Flp pilus assembly protein TadG